MDPNVLVDSLTTLTQQLALCSNQPSVKFAQSLVDFKDELRAEVAGLTDKIAELNQTVIAIR